MSLLIVHAVFLTTIILLLIVHAVANYGTKNIIFYYENITNYKYVDKNERIPVLVEVPMNINYTLTFVLKFIILQ